MVFLIAQFTFCHQTVIYVSHAWTIFCTFLLDEILPPELQEQTFQKNVVPLTLRMRAATATSLGAAAAHAKLLAAQEEREIEHLLASVIETQVGFFFFFFGERALVTFAEVGIERIIGARMQKNCTFSSNKMCNFLSIFK